MTSQLVQNSVLSRVDEKRAHAADSARARSSVANE
jgi:hypothetical protein